MEDEMCIDEEMLDDAASAEVVEEPSFVTEDGREMYEHFRFVADKGQQMIRVDKFLVDAWRRPHATVSSRRQMPGVS